MSARAAWAVLPLLTFLSDETNDLMFKQHGGILGGNILQAKSRVVGADNVFAAVGSAAFNQEGRPDAIIGHGLNRPNNGAASPRFT